MAANLPSLNSSLPIIVLVGGTDPSAGAGLSADLRTCSDFGCWGWPIVSAVIAQNTMTVRHLHALPVESLRAQWRSVLDEVQPVVVKIGVLGSPSAVEVALEFIPELRAAGCQVVFDPVTTSGLGDPLSKEGMLQTLRLLLPHVDVLTPNMVEARALTGLAGRARSDMEPLAASLLQAGSSAIVLKGGHIDGAPGDLLISRAMHRFFPNEEVFEEDVHGTGCHLASAIACGVAKGQELELALQNAKVYLASLLRNARQRTTRGRSILLPRST